jgi:aminoglycoside phosphotransferase (APT) family kinase protein
LNHDDIIQTTKLKGGFTGEVALIEMMDGRRFVHKSYPHPEAEITREWDSLVFLYNKGYSVPKPIRKDANSIYMQYIENGNLWEIYENANEDSREILIHKFAKLLYELHILDITDFENPYSCGFIENELNEIENILNEKQLNKYFPALEHLRFLSANMKESPLCFIHRDFHPWNILVGSDEKLFAVDMPLAQGDFRFDAGWTYMLMARSGFDEFAEEFISAYGKLNPLVYDDLNFYKSLANLRWLANVGTADSDYFRFLIQNAEKFL